MTETNGSETPRPDSTDLLRQVLDLEYQAIIDSKKIYTGTTPPQYGGRVFGGQVLAQALIAAGDTVDDDRHLHSMHAYFVRPGDAQVPINFVVEEVRDGRSFSVRHVAAQQHGKTILTLTCSFQAEASGMDFFQPMPQGMPDPRSIPSTEELLGGIDHPQARQMASRRPFDIRMISEPVYIGPAQERSSQTACWLKTFSGIELGHNQQAAALAYAADYMPFDPILRQAGLFWATPGISMASLDHAMWFHRPIKVDEWMLYVLSNPSTQSARGTSIGQFYSTAGDLIATVAQEGMIRTPDDDNAPSS